MSEEILVNVTPRETRVAVVENGVLQEVQIERVVPLGALVHKSASRSLCPARADARGFNLRRL